MLTFYLVAYATVQMYDITTNRQSILLKRMVNKLYFYECVTEVTWRVLSGCSVAFEQWDQPIPVSSCLCGSDLKSWRFHHFLP